MCALERVKAAGIAAVLRAAKRSTVRRLYYPRPSRTVSGIRSSILWTCRSVVAFPSYLEVFGAAETLLDHRYQWRARPRKSNERDVLQSSWQGRAAKGWGLWQSLETCGIGEKEFALMALASDHSKCACRAGAAGARRTPG